MCSDFFGRFMPQINAALLVRADYVRSPRHLSHQWGHPQRAAGGQQPWSGVSLK